MLSRLSSLKLAGIRAVDIEVFKTSVPTVVCVYEVQTTLGYWYIRVFGATERTPLSITRPSKNRKHQSVEIETASILPFIPLHDLLPLLNQDVASIQGLEKRYCSARTKMWWCLKTHIPLDIQLERDQKLSLGEAFYILAPLLAKLRDEYEAIGIMLDLTRYNIKDLGCFCNEYERRLTIAFIDTVPRFEPFIRKRFDRFLDLELRTSLLFGSEFGSL